MPEQSCAREIVLRKLNLLAPPFHRHIVRAKLLGTTCRTGDHMVVYEIVRTDPDGEVAVTRETLIRFEDD